MIKILFVYLHPYFTFILNHNISKITFSVFNYEHVLDAVI